MTYAQAAPLGLVSFPLPEEGAVIYDENGNGKADLGGDAWVFDTDNDGGAELIIRFRQDSVLRAEVYDDTDQNGQVDYAIGPDKLQIAEKSWRVEVMARDAAWTLANGSPDWNLDLQADSGLAAGIAAPVSTSGNCQISGDTTGIAFFDQKDDPHYGSSAIDGTPDFRAQYWDTNQDGSPDYEWRSVNGSSKNDLLIANANPALRPTATHRFPPLETLLRVDWSNARLAGLNALIPPRANEAGYSLLFSHPTTPGQISSALENPLASYDLHGDQDCHAELQIRAVSEAADPLRPNLVAYNEIRYSWAQDADALQYRLYLLGQVYDESVWQYPPYPVAHVNYTALADFALSHTWRGAAFAEAETGLKTTSLAEGLPENTLYTNILRRVSLSNRAEKLPARYLSGKLNLREEYKLTGFNQKPRLYFSPIDLRLHLLGAAEGTIIFAADTANAAPGFDFSQKALGSGELAIAAETRYADTDGDGYTDTWTYLQGGQKSQELVIRPGVALFADGSGLELKQLPAEVAATGWEVLPPASPDEWKKLAEQLKPYQTEKRPLNDLAGVFSKLPGEVSQMPGALVMVSTQGRNLLAEITTSDGQKILRAQNGEVWTENSTPATLELSPLALNAPAQPVDGLAGTLTFSLKNPGNRDVAARVLVQDALTRQTTLLDEEKVIPALGQVDFALPFAPALPGAHTLNVQVEFGGQTLRQELPWQADLPDPAPQAIFLAQPYTGAALTLMGLLAVFIAVGAWQALKEGEDDGAE